MKIDTQREPSEAPRSTPLPAEQIRPSVREALEHQLQALDDRNRKPRRETAH